MSYEEKNTWAFGVIALVGYLVYLVLTFVMGDGPFDPDGYVGAMIWSIGGAIVAGILAGIVIAIAGGKGGGRIDQRDREIGWLGERVGNSLSVIAGIAALILCFVQAPHPFIANTLYLGFVLAGIVQAMTKLAAYRQGF